MALGAVALGYGAPGGHRGGGARGPRTAWSARSPPVLEEELAAELAPADARGSSRCASSRPAPRRWRRRCGWRASPPDASAVLGCGYHGWLDWCQGRRPQGVPPADARALRRAAVQRRRAHPRADPRARATRSPPWCSSRSSWRRPIRDWLAVLREETARAGAMLIADEIKTVGRLAVGGALRALRRAARSGRGGQGDRQRLSARRGRRSGGDHGRASGGPGSPRRSPPSGCRSPPRRPRSGCSSSRAGARASRPRRGAGCSLGFGGLAGAPRERGERGGGGAGDVLSRVSPESAGAAVAVEAARRGLLFKRGAYNFVSLAHDEAAVDRALEVLEEALGAVAR